MKHFRASGLWSVGDEPGKRVAGTLHYSKSGLHLKLLGGFRDGWSPTAEGYPLVHGVVSRNPYGEFVTLIDGFTTRSTSPSSGIESETISFNSAIVGDNHLPPDYRDFDAVDVSLSHLSEWYGRSGIQYQTSTSEGRFDLTIRYHQPEAVRFAIGKETLSIGMAARAENSRHGASVEEAARFLVRPLPQLTAREIHGRFVYPLQNLLTFATDTPNAIEEIKLMQEVSRGDRPNWNRRHYLIFNPAFASRETEKPITSDKILISYSDIEIQNINIIENWMRFEERHKTFSAVYFSSLYAPPRYFDERFLRLMSAFTLLTTTLYSVTPRTAEFLAAMAASLEGAFSEEERRLLVPIIPTGPEIEMPLHLLRLLEKHRSIMVPVIGKEPRDFVESVSEMMSFCSRWIGAPENHPDLGGEVNAMTLHVGILIKALILEELGFPVEIAHTLIQKTSQYLYAKLRISK